MFKADKVYVVLEIVDGVYDEPDTIVDVAVFYNEDEATQYMPFMEREGRCKLFEAPMCRTFLDYEANRKSEIAKRALEKLSDEEKLALGLT